MFLHTISSSISVYCFVCKQSSITSKIEIIIEFGTWLLCHEKYIKLHIVRIRTFGTISGQIRDSLFCFATLQLLACILGFCFRVKAKFNNLYDIVETFWIVKNGTLKLRVFEKATTFLSFSFDITSKLRGRSLPFL